MLRVGVDHVRKVGGAAGNQNFLLATSLGDVVLKASAIQDFVPGAWACERVRREGVRAPEVLALETTADTLPLPFLLLRAVPGSPATAERAALGELGRQLAAVHTVRVPGFGELRVSAGTARGVEPTWVSAVARLVAEGDALVRARILDEATATRAVELVGELDARDFDGPAALLHTDLKLEHVLVDEEGHLGIIDWDDAMAGDPLFDLGRLSIAGPAVLDPVLVGYGLDLDERLARVLAGYRLAWNLDSLGYELCAGGSWFAPEVARVEADLRALA